MESPRAYPQAFYEQFSFLVQGDDGWWRWPAEVPEIPLTFSVCASKPL